MCPSTTDCSVQYGSTKWLVRNQSKQLPPCYCHCHANLHVEPACAVGTKHPRILDLIFGDSNSVHKFTHRGLSFCCSSVSLFTTFLYLPGNSQLSHVNLVPNHAPEVHATRKCKSSTYTYELVAPVEEVEDIHFACDSNSLFLQLLSAQAAQHSEV